MKIISFNKPFANDHDLVKALQQRNRKAEEHLYNTHKSMITNLVLKNSGSHDEALDLYQETLLIVLKKISRPDFVLTAQLKTLIYGIAQRLWLKELRKKKKMPTAYTINDDENDDTIGVFEKYLEIPTEDTDNYAQALEILAKAKAKLGNQCQEMVTAWYNRQRDETEALATQFGKNADSLRLAVHKCREKLREQFEPLWKAYIN